MKIPWLVKSGSRLLRSLYSGKAQFIIIQGDYIIYYPNQDIVREGALKITIPGTLGTDCPKHSRTYGN